MADLSVTESLVTPDNDSQTYRNYEVSEAITAGQAVAQDAAGLLIKAIADTADNADVIGIAMTSATGTGEYVTVAERGSIVTGATMVAGQYYVLSATAGGIAPFSDLTTGDFATYVFVAESTTTARILRYETGIQVA